MSDVSKIYKQKQLKSKEDTFDFSQTMFQQVNNEYWREKSNIWHIISAACNDAASETYIKLREYVKNLADIDVCTIHNLKSIAQSVDVKHLMEFTDNLQTFPLELRELLDILSIKSSKLMEANQKLHFSSLLPLLGNIDLRSCLIRPQKISLSLLIDIFDNIDKIEKWFKFNSILPNATIKFIFDRNKNDDYSNIFLDQAKLYNSYLTDQNNIWYYGFDERQNDFNVIWTKLNNVLYLTVQDIINNIKNLKNLIKQNQTDISKGSQLAQLLSFQFKYDKKSKNQKQYIVNTFNTNSIVVYKNGKYILNPFFALIEIVKARLYSSKQDGLPLLPYYKDQGDNEVTINMNEIYENMIQTIKKNDQCYIRNFIFFHIYNLIFSKIINDKLRDDFEIELTPDNKIKHITFISKYSELTYDQFYPAVSSWISNNELKEFLGQKIDQNILNITNFEEIETTNKITISHYKKEYEDFIQYLSLVKVITREYDEQRKLPYLIYRYNNKLDKTIPFNIFYRNLLGINDDGSYNDNNYVQKVAEYLTDICIKISYIREEIKGLVQQYSFIGTQRIITDVVRDYFVKNFSKRSNWRYISDKFKNKDNSASLKTIVDLNGNKQFTAQLIEYFDQTDYLNIQTDLPQVINGYTDVISTVPSTFIITENTVSSYILSEDKISTLYDTLGFEIPSQLYPSPSMISTITIPAVSVQGTNLYNELVAYNSNTSNLVTIQNDNIISTTIISSEQPIINQFTNYIQTIPQQNIIGEGSQSSVFKNYCLNTLNLSEQNYEKLNNAVNKLTISSQVIENNTYYSVLAEITNTSMSSAIISQNTNIINLTNTSSPNNGDILSTVRFPAPTKVNLQEQQQLTGEFYNPTASSFVIPKGTSVSSILPAGTEITINVISTLHIPNWVDGNELVEKSNARFWEKNIEYLGWEDLSAQISFYEKYFPELQNAITNELKLNIYKEQIYPLLTEIWDIHATSGMLDGQNNAIHQQYSGQYPGKQLERNIGNQDFTTIAPLPYIPNLIPVNEYQNDDSYIVKPLYDNISYYMNMFMNQMFNMYKIQADNGFAIAIDGWKQTHIELKGYCSKYERSANTISTENEMNSKLDWDGPWVYSSLKDFLSLKKEGSISKTDIDYYVDNYFFNIGKFSDNIKNKLFRYQQEIFDKGDKWKLYSFETDINDNQYTLFKRKDYFKYEDAGQIWVRMKNFPLSMPLMNRNVVIDFKDIKYVNDPYDTLLSNEDSKYANMLKQMTNNAVQFGIIKNTMWILGWTNYTMNASKRLMYNDVDKVLKLISFSFKTKEDFTLIVDSLSFQSFSLIEQSDKLNNFNQFVGVNYRQKDDTIDYILFDKNNSQFIIYNSSDPFNPKSIPFTGTDLALQIETIDALINNTNNSSNIELGHTYIINGLNNRINIGTIYFNNEKYIISGYSGQKENNNTTIYDQVLDNITGSFVYFINNENLNNTIINSVNLISGNFDKIINTPFSAMESLTENDVKLINNLQFIPLINLNIDVNKETNKCEQLFSTISSYSSYANIWRISSDENNTGIAFETYDFEGKEQLSSLFIKREQNTQNQKTINNIFAANCQLLTKQVIDSNNNIVYMNQIKTISTNIITTSVYLNDNNINDYIAIQQMFPACHLTKENNLVISSLITTLGSYKSLTVDKEQKNIQQINGMKLLTSTIDPLVVCDSTFEDIITNENSYFYRNNQRIELDDQLNTYKKLFNDISGTYNFYQYYDKYIEAKINEQPLSTQKEYLELYNQQMAKLNNVVAFAPVINEFIIQPLKIIFNFGNEFAFDINQVNPSKTNYFDLDIKTYINTPEEQFKKVGWKAGNWATDYINWITRDERFGGPEIVIVDIEKYKNNHIDNYKVNLKDYSLDIIVDACWFAESQIQSLNPNIFINWKGFTYQYMIEDIETNENVCDFPFLKIKVGLNNNTLKCYRKILIATGLTNKHTGEKLFGFIRMWEDEQFDQQFIKANYETEDWSINIALTKETIFRNYQQFENALLDQQIAEKMLRLIGIYDINQINKITDSLNWNKTMIVEVEKNKQIEFHIKKIII